MADNVDGEVLLALAERCETAHEEETRALLGQAFDLICAKQLPAKPGFINWNPIWLRFDVLCKAGGFLDAATLLIPKGWQTFEVKQDHDGAEWHWTIYPAFMLNKRKWGQAPSAALALCAAALRARAASLNSAHNRMEREDG